jgi:uncharacterized repeat protein (TIGR03803 family)
MSFAKFTRSLLLILLGVVAAASGWAQTYEVLYSFTGGADGAFPQGSLIRDSSGNLYGTTVGTGIGGTLAGSVFKLSAGGKFTPLFNFGASNAGPSESLVRDSAGNLFGTTYEGGQGNGTVFKLDRKNNFSVIYNFPGGASGAGPVVFALDPAGNLYGEAGGGSYYCDGADHVGCGLVFKLDPSGNETVLHAFKDGKKGSSPGGGLLRDAAGNLYGTTRGSFNPYSVVVFELDPAGHETVLYRFNRKGQGNGPAPNGDLIQDAAGNFYGTTFWGGSQAGICKGYGPCGLVFKLDPNNNETVLYTFVGQADGFNPVGGLVMDSAGNLYGTTRHGGVFSNTCGVGCGVVFKLDPSGKETVLYSFTGGADGFWPYAGLTMDASGNLYGTTSRGGNNNDCLVYSEVGCGVLFKIKP